MDMGQNLEMDKQNALGIGGMVNTLVNFLLMRWRYRYLMDMWLSLII